MAGTKSLSASLEDYLEAIFYIIQEKQAVRAKDISKRLNVNSSSVTGALRSLAEKGLINYAPYDVITLTRRGRHAAGEVVRRHEVLRTFLVEVLRVDAEEADAAACKMEHAVSANILERFVRYIEFVALCPRMRIGPARGFESYCEEGKTKEDCEQCILHCLEGVRAESEAEEDEVGDEAGKTERRVEL